MSGNEELKKLIKDMVAKGINLNTGGSGQPVQNNTFTDLGRFRPPIPSVGVDGDIS